MSTDSVYQALLRDATKPVVTRGHACRRAAPCCITFRTTPLVCVRRTAWRQALQEFAWFMSGSTRVADLPKAVRPWWEPWGDGAGYGRFAESFQENRFSIWDPSGPLPPCSFTGFSFVDGHATMYQRSCDLVCGAPHDWIQLWAYCLWLAAKRGVRLQSVRWICVDPHVYERHDKVVARILEQPCQKSPALLFWGDGFKAENFELSAPYVPALTLKAELIV